MNSILPRALISAALNALKVVASFVTGILIARGLGVQDYGTLSFLIASFTSLRLLLDMGTSSAFFTFISKSSRSKRFFFYYACWITIQFIVSLAFIILIAPDKWVETIWQGEERVTVVLAFIAIFGQQILWTAITQVAESQRLTIRIHQMNFCIAVFHLLAIGLLLSSGGLSIEVVLIFIAIEFVVAAIYTSRYLGPFSASGDTTFRDVFQEYKQYCLPLVPFVWTSLISVFANRWLLQEFGGSSEQALYGIAVQFTTIAFLLLGPIFNILWKEIAEANQQNNFKKLYDVYSQARRVMFLLPACLAGFSLPWTSEIIASFLGTQYAAAVLPMKIMLVYGLWQSVGAINTNMLLALELTRARTVIGLFFALVSLPLTYFMLAPSTSNLPGMDLGASGLALKMLLLIVINVNVSGYWIARVMNWTFDWRSQFITTSTTFIVGFLCYYVLNHFSPYWISDLLTMSIGAAVYLMLIGIICLKAPFFLGLRIADVTIIKNLALQFLRPKRP